MNFKKALEYGQEGERELSSILLQRGFSLVPTCNLPSSPGKGPRLQDGKAGIVLPDFMVFSRAGYMCIEAKHKKGFTWYRNRNRHGVCGSWQTGIDLSAYEQYKKFAEETKTQIMICFLHDGGAAKDSEVSPKGLFWNFLQDLEYLEDHRSDRWGKHGMVYWNIDDLYTEDLL